MRCWSTHHALLEVCKLGAEAVLRRRQPSDARLVDGVGLGVAAARFQVGGVRDVEEHVVLPDVVFTQEGKHIARVGQAVGLRWGW